MLVDSHCHLDLEPFDADRTAVLERARAAGVGDLVLPAISRSRWPALAALCVADARLHPAYGLHPVFLDQHRDGDVEALAEWLERNPAVAIGECGLDHHHAGLDRDRQAALFTAQLELARDLGMPVIVHARRAVEAVLLAIRRVGRLRGVVHSFSGSPEQARQLWNAGFLVGLGGPLTYPRASRLRRLVATMPIEHLLLETDAPDQPNRGRQGHRNEPAHLVEVLAVVSELRDEPAEQVAAATTANAKRLFGLD